MSEFDQKIGSSVKSKLNTSHYQDYFSLSEDEFYQRRPSTFVFVVGFPKTASTTISASLDAHPQVSLPRFDEPFFFPTDEFEYGMGFYWEKYFEGMHPEGAVAVDGNTANSFLPFVPQRIHSKIPDAKIIVSLRDPIGRAFSNWRMYVGSGEENLSFEEATKWELHEFEHGLIPLDNEEFWKQYMRRLMTRDALIRKKALRTYLVRGLYAHHISRFIDFFGSQQVFVVFQEELKNRKQEIMNRLFEFIGVAPIEVSSQDYKVSSRNIKFRKMVNTIYRNPQVRQTVNYAPTPLTRTLRRVINSADIFFPKDKIPSSLERELRAFYSAYDKQLRELLGRSLPWESKH